MISKLIRNMSTPSRIPLRTNLITNKYTVNLENNSNSYTYMYQALVKNKINNYTKYKTDASLNKDTNLFNDLNDTETHK